MDPSVIYFINREYEKFKNILLKNNTENNTMIFMQCTDIACNNADYDEIEILFDMFNKINSSINFNPIILSLTLQDRSRSDIWTKYRLRDVFGKNPLILAYENNNIKAIKCIINFSYKHNILDSFFSSYFDLFFLIDYQVMKMHQI